MAHSDVRLLTCPDGYKLGLGDDTSDLVDFGEPLEWEAPNGKRYLAFVDLPVDAGEEAENVESQLDSWVYEVKPLAHVEPEDDEGEGGGSDGDEDDDEDEGESDEDVPGANDVESPSADLGPGPGEDDDDDKEDDEEPIYG